MGFVPLEDQDCEVNIGHRQAGECIVRRGPACLRDAAIRWKTAFFFPDCVCIVPMVYTDAQRHCQGLSSTPVSMEIKIVALVRE